MGIPARLPRPCPHTSRGALPSLHKKPPSMPRPFYLPRSEPNVSRCFPHSTRCMEFDTPCPSFYTPCKKFHTHPSHTLPRPEKLKNHRPNKPAPLSKTPLRAEKSRKRGEKICELNKKAYFCTRNSGCSSARLEYASGGRVVAGSNPVTPTGFKGSKWLRP